MGGRGGAEGGEVAFGVELAEVHLGVQDVLGMARIHRERARAESPADAPDGLVHRGLDHCPSAHGPVTRGREVRIGALAVDLGGGCIQRPLRPAEGHVDRAEVREGVRVGAGPVCSRHQWPRHGDTGSEPTCGHSDPAVPEPGPVEVRAVIAEGAGRDVREGHFGGTAARHSRVGPVPGSGCDTGLAQVHGEEARCVVVECGDQGVRAHVAAGAPGLDPAEQPGAARPPSGEHGCRWFGGPHSPQFVAADTGALHLGEDRVRVDVGFDQTACGDVARAEFGERGPAGAGVAPRG